MDLTLKPYDNKTLLFIAVISLFLSCKNEKTDTKSNSTITKTAINLAGPYFFASRTTSPIDSTKYNYHFIEFTVDDKNNAKGVFYYSPYGTDGYRGSFKSVVDSSGTLKSQRTYLAEGERYTDNLDYKVETDKIKLGFNDPNGDEATLPKVDKQSYDEMFKAYQNSILESHLNTKNRKRLKSMGSLKKDLGYTEKDIENLKFMEAMVDLDNDPMEMEYLLYIMDPMICGSGGCNLYILEEDGSLIEKLTVTSPPIYVDLNDIASAEKGKWRNLYVYSKGMRIVSPEDGSYPTNPSVLNEIQLEELQSFPEQYQLIMDYLD